MTPPLRDLGTGSSVYYGSIAGIWVMIIHRPAFEADMLLARSALQAMKKVESWSFPTLTWVLESAGVKLDAPSRAAAAAITSEFADSMSARATLIEGDGFQAATVRAVVAGVDLLSRGSSPRKVFSVPEPAIAWCFSKRRTKSTETVASVAAVLQARIAQLLNSSARERLG